MPPSLNKDLKKEKKVTNLNFMSFNSGRGGGIYRGGGGSVFQTLVPFFGDFDGIEYRKYIICLLY